MEKEVTHNLWRPVEDGAGTINFLVTISATTKGDSPSNLSNWENELDEMKTKWIDDYVMSKLWPVLDERYGNYIFYSRNSMYFKNMPSYLKNNSF